MTCRYGVPSGNTRTSPTGKVDVHAALPSSEVTAMRRSTAEPDSLCTSSAATRLSSTSTDAALQ